MKWHASEGPPCRHMESFLNEAADGSSKGWRRWYAFAHAARCTRCESYLRRLEETLNRLRVAKTQTLPDGVVNRLEALLARESDAKI